MSTSIAYPHLVIEADGTARITGTRYKVRHLAAEHYQYGWTAEELLRQHTDLRPEQVYAAMTYFYDHFDEIIGELKHLADVVETAPTCETVSRDELLRRRDMVKP